MRGSICEPSYSASSTIGIVDTQLGGRIRFGGGTCTPKSVDCSRIVTAGVIGDRAPLYVCDEIPALEPGYTPGESVADPKPAERGGENVESAMLMVDGSVNGSTLGSEADSEWDRWTWMDAGGDGIDDDDEAGDDLERARARRRNKAKGKSGRHSIALQELVLDVDICVREEAVDEEKLDETVVPLGLLLDGGA